MKHSSFKPIKNVKSIGDKSNKAETSDVSGLEIGMGTSGISGLKIDINISVGAVNEYAKSILGRYPKDNREFSTALQTKALEETKCL